MTGGPIWDSRIIADQNDRVTFWARSRNKATGNRSREFERSGKEFGRPGAPGCTLFPRATRGLAASADTTEEINATSTPIAAGALAIASRCGTREMEASAPAQSGCSPSRGKSQKSTAPPCVPQASNLLSGENRKDSPQRRVGTEPTVRRSLPVPASRT